MPNGSDPAARPGPAPASGANPSRGGEKGVAGGPVPGPGGADGTTPGAAHAEPTFRIVAGHPTPEELAALTAALSIKLAARLRPPLPRRRGAWADRAALLTAPPSPGPGAWRRSTWPR